MRKYVEQRKRHLQRLQEEEGAATLEFLVTSFAVFGMILLVAQVAIVFVHAILVNHAMGLAAHEATARGGFDCIVVSQFQSHLPGNLRRNIDLATGGGLTFEGQPAPNCFGSDFDVFTEGSEPTTRNSNIAMTFTYEENLWMLKMLGVDKSVTMQRTLKVNSQTTRENN